MTRTVFILVALLPFMTFATSPLAAEEPFQYLEPALVYKRCYVRMTRMIPSETDPLLVKVTKKQISAAEACIELFDRAQFTTSGVLKDRTSAEAKSILKTFHDMHRSWFQSKTNGNRGYSALIHDMEEDALYFTRAAFLPKTQFKSVVTLNMGLAGVRDQASYPNETNDFLSQGMFTYSSDTIYNSYNKSSDLIIAYTHMAAENSKYKNLGVFPLTVPSNRIVEMGELAGVKPAVSLTFPSFRKSNSRSPEILQALLPNLSNFEANEHFGGGVIGSQAFIANNNNIEGTSLPDGYTNINRRGTSRIYEDLLCHQLPTLTEEDVQTEVRASEHTFQQNTSCMQCHSSIDELALGYRNIAQFISASNPSKNQTVGVNISGYTRLPASDGAKTFALQTPKATLHYRELVTGTKKKVSASSIAEIGQRLSEGQDLYTCAAKRYYRFFTGVDVDLVPTTLEVRPIDKHHRDRVIALGKELKKTQSVRTLLLSIFSSDTFQSTNYMTERPEPTE